MDIYDIWFSRIQISNNIKIKMINRFKTSEIFNFNKDILYGLNLKENTINEIMKLEYKQNLEKYENYLEKEKIELIRFDDKSYPYKLKNIDNMPTYIFVKGNKDILFCDSVAIIGSRDCSEAGKKIAFLTAKELGDRNVNVVSGLAMRNRYICTSWKFKKQIWKNYCRVSKWIS